jgi:hypothetical protein
MLIILKAADAITKRVPESLVALWMSIWKQLVDAFHYNTISSGFRKTVFVAIRGSFKPVGIEHQRLSVISGKLLTFSKLCKEVLLLRIAKLETATRKVQIQTATQ